MRFGLIFEHQLARPWDGGAEHRLYQEALDQIELADRLGFDCVWVVEHHFLEEYSHSSAPDVFLAAASQRTEQIRLGFGVLPLPPGYQHPARVAETVATLDLVSNGRVELGTGETTSGAALAGFGVDRESKRAQWEESLDAVTRMFVETPFAGYDGRYFSMPPRNVVPKPRQTPHPPLWVSCPRRETIRLAAEKGIGALSFSFVDPEEARAWVGEYEQTLTSDSCVPGGFAVNPSVAVALPMHVHTVESEAISRGIDGAHFFAYAQQHYEVFGDHVPGETDLWAEFLARREEVGYSRSAVVADGTPLEIRFIREGAGSLRGAIGTPAQVGDLVRRYEQAGVDQLIFAMQTGKTQHAHICEALELFAAEVMPEFAQRAADVEAAKRARLAPAVAAALARRSPARPAPRGVSFGPMDSGEPMPDGVRVGASTGAAAVPVGAAAAPANGVAAAPANGVAAAGLRSAALRRQLEARGEAAFRAFVRRSDDRRLERTAGSAQGLKLIFHAMQGQFVPDAAGGFTGDIGYELRFLSGEVKTWTVSITVDGASARAGRGQPKLTIKMAVADFVRLAAGELDAGRALLEGKLDLEGDFSLAARLGDMFGQPSAF